MDNYPIGPCVPRNDEAVDKCGGMVLKSGTSKTATDLMSNGDSAPCKSFVVVLLLILSRDFKLTITHIIHAQNVH